MLEEWKAGTLSATGSPNSELGSPTATIFMDDFQGTGALLKKYTVEAGGAAEDSGYLFLVYLDLSVWDSDLPGYRDRFPPKIYTVDRIPDTGQWMIIDTTSAPADIGESESE
jgi:hypothetical protein